MSRRVWKFPLDLEAGSQSLRLPQETRIVHVAMQAGAPTLWALIDTGAPTVQRDFVIRATGEPVAIDETYVGTVFTEIFVWHVFEVVPV